MINVLNIRDVSKQLSCSRKFVYDLHAAGKLVGFKISDGRKGLRWFERDVDEYILRRAGVVGAGHETEAPAPPVRPIDVRDILNPKRSKLRLAI